MKIKFNTLIGIILAIFAIAAILIFTYTAYCNEAASITSNSAISQKTIIIDAGHGGMDGGSVGVDGTVEKEINLKIALKLEFILKAYGYNVIMTRKDDKSIHDSSANTVRQQKVSDIHNREKIILQNPDAIFVSIHQNHYPNSSIHGTQVFYSKNNILSKELAQNIQSSIVKNIDSKNKRQIKKSGTEIYLLYHSKIPSVMVECGFISNYNDLNKLKDENYQKKLVLSIADGIVNYYKIR